MRLAMVSTYPPRRCGLATYAQDLVQALSHDIDVVVCAIDREGLEYPDEVVTVIKQDDPADYRRAGRKLAEHNVDAVLIQHEYGIFGGPAGAYVLNLTEELTQRGIPYLVTLHTVLADLDEEKRSAISAFTEGASAITVFTDAARHLAVQSRTATADSNLVVVPHGVPTVVRAAAEIRRGLTPARRSHSVRREVAQMIEEVGDARLLSSFGLIGRSKGIETAISALPAVIEKHPDVRYLIAGATHPDIVRSEGEAYRESLQARAEELGVSDHVLWVDSYLTTGELGALLARTDIYLTPYRERQQSCSGALTYAIAAACAVVSTNYFYAEEMLGSGAGTTVEIDDTAAFADAINELLDDPERLEEAQATADRVGAELTWPAVAHRHQVLLRELVAPVSVRVGAEPAIPELQLHHLGVLSDEIGIIQFGRGREADTDSGYCVDDVVRLGIVGASLLGQPQSSLPPGTWRTATDWIASTLRFVNAAKDRVGMRNQMSYSGVWEDDPHLGDHIGRALWGLGVIAAGRGVPSPLREQARALRDEVAAQVEAMPWLRTNAYAILGVTRETRLSPTARATLTLAADRLDRAWHTGEPSWRWFEPQLTYDNARIPQALIAAGHRLGDPGMVRRGIQALDWYARQVGLATVDGVLRTVTNLWRDRGEEPNLSGDEQPLDASATVEALVEAYHVSGNSHYGRLARRAFGWFLGVNRFGTVMYDEVGGGVHDGIGPTWVNPNEGAESTLAYYQALFALVEADLVRLPGAVIDVGAPSAVTASQR